MDDRVRVRSGVDGLIQFQAHRPNAGGDERDVLEPQSIRMDRNQKKDVMIIIVF